MNNDKYLQLQDSYLSCMSIEETCEEVPLAFFISPIFENRHFLVQVVVVSLDLKIELGSCQSQMLSHILLPHIETLKLTAKCFKYVQILSFMANFLYVILAKALKYKVSSYAQS